MTVRFDPTEFVVVVDLAVVSCGSDDAAVSTTVAPVTSEAEPAVTTTPIGGSAAPAGDGFGQTEACDRLTPAELSAAFGITFEDGTEITEGHCLFNSDGSPRSIPSPEISDGLQVGTR